MWLSACQVLMEQIVIRARLVHDSSALPFMIHVQGVKHVALICADYVEPLDYVFERLIFEAHVFSTSTFACVIEHSLTRLRKREPVVSKYICRLRAAHDWSYNLDDLLWRLLCKRSLSCNRIECQDKQLCTCGCPM